MLPPDDRTTASGSEGPPAQDVSPLWERPYPYDVIQLDPADDGEWESLQREFGRDPSHPLPPIVDRPLARCLEVLRENGAHSLVVETRYIDADYRSEYSAFYSRAFLGYHDTTKRLHFFEAEVAPDEVWRLTRSQMDSYLGYIVLRPQVRPAVGRTMIKPPVSLRASVRTRVSETVTFFGQSLFVKAVPFMQQDARLGSCAQVALWMCHYSAYRADHRVVRRPVADFSLLVNPGLGLGRSIPSQGLTLNQITDVLAQVGLPTLYYSLSNLEDEDRPAGIKWLREPDSRHARTTRVCCRYLNSGLPLIGIVSLVKAGQSESVDFRRGSLHAVLVCGYHRVNAAVRLIAHDDRRGPYLEYASTEDDYDDNWAERSRWEQVLAPLPEKLWLTGEAAERTGCEQLVAAARKAKATGVAAAGSMVKAFEDGNLTFRTFAITGSRLKERLAGRGTGALEGGSIDDAIVVRAYREARLPRYVWVVEAIDRTERDTDSTSPFGPKCVYGEIVIDATSDPKEPNIVALRVPGVVTVPRPDVEGGDLPTPFAELIHTAGQFRP